MPLSNALRDPRRGPAVALVALLLAAGSSAAWYATDALVSAHDDYDHAHAGEGSHAHAGHAHAHEGVRADLPSFDCPQDARIPDSLGRVALESVGGIAIRGDEGFTPAAGVRAGSGTATDPFVISGLRTPVLQLSDTRAYFLVAGNAIGTLVLDWNGKGGLVCKNHIGDLRVNRNVERVEAPTAGVIADNRIDKVGQIRHYDGLFVGNEVGTATSRGVVLNIDGMNGADFARNLIRGGVDMKLHGHHHGVPGSSHMHVAGTNETDAEDHTTRHILFRFHDNVIDDPSGFGLRYNDRNHAGDDRTAASESAPELEKPHVHHTEVLIENNTVRGAPLRVEIFNAKDERHLAGERGALVVRNNVVKDSVAGSGIIVSAVANGDVLLAGNRVERATVAGLVPLSLGTAAGIDLVRVENSTVTIAGNTVSGFTYGVRAREFDGGTTWTVGKNAVTGAKRDVWWDQSVANPPAQP